MLNSGIYCINNKVNNKKYIGQTKQLDKRKSEHIRSLRGAYHYNEYLQRSFDKYGIGNFELIVLERCELSQLDEKETEYINQYNTMDRSIGYNLRSGGHKPKLSKESKKKISETRLARIAKGQISIQPRIFTEDEKTQTGARIKRMYIDNPKLRMKLSISKTNMSLEVIKDIKKLLYSDVDIKKISGICKVEVHNVSHIKNLYTFEWVYPKLNYYIKNREIINNAIQESDILKRYRNGETYQSIASIKSIDIRTVIRKVNNNKTELDERMRENKRMFERVNKYKQVKRLRKMGKDIRNISRTMGMSTATVCDILKGRWDNEVYTIGTGQLKMIG